MLSRQKKVHVQAECRHGVSQTRFNNPAEQSLERVFTEELPR